MLKHPKNEERPRGVMDLLIVGHCEAFYDLVVARFVFFKRFTCYSEEGVEGNVVERWELWIFTGYVDEVQMDAELAFWGLGWGWGV